MTPPTSSKSYIFPRIITLIALAAVFAGYPVGTRAQSNSCPVDGCQVEIVGASATEDGEIRLLMWANFRPQLTKNHLHIWWGENWGVTQVTGNAERLYDNPQGVYHPIDDFPAYTTTGVVAVEHRGEATTLCVTAADRNHNILDPEFYQCVSVAALLGVPPGPPPSASAEPQASN